MFARRAAASESSHARDEAKANLLRWNEKHEKEISMQIEKISALQIQKRLALLQIILILRSVALHSAMLPTVIGRNRVATCLSLL